MLIYKSELSTEDYQAISHLWIFDDGVLKTHKKEGNEIHAHIFGEKAWHINERGWYSESTGMIRSYSSMAQGHIKRLAKAFPEAIYYCE